jgi:hypothetical protein
MFGLAAVFFFSVTGITLNHPGWFFANAQSSQSFSGAVDTAWVSGDDVNKLDVVETLRATHNVRGRLSGFEIDDSECVVVFKGPGYSADAYIDRDTGEYSLTETRAGFVAVMNDLHKGRDTGPAWSLVIDITSLLLCIASATGLILLLYIKKRRRLGIAVAFAGTILVAVIYAVFV